MHQMVSIAFLTTSAVDGDSNELQTLQSHASFGRDLTRQRRIEPCRRVTQPQPNRTRTGSAYKHHAPVT